MKKAVFIIILTSFFGFVSCKEKQKKEAIITTDNPVEKTMQIDDGRLSLKLNEMQKNHQLSNMRSHLEAVQQITVLLAEENYKEASKLAYSKLGSTTEMRLMCASFGDKNFEALGLGFHKSADKMSEVFKSRNKDKSLKALSNTLNYCVQCHATYKQ